MKNASYYRKQIEVGELLLARGGNTKAVIKLIKDKIEEHKENLKKA